ncbi:uncharacterized protein TM35_000331670, partial [Trypanosoma theileri]
FSSGLRGSLGGRRTSGILHIGLSLSVLSRSGGDVSRWRFLLRGNVTCIVAGRIGVPGGCLNVLWQARPPMLPKSRRQNSHRSEAGCGMSWMRGASFWGFSGCRALI